MGVSTVEKPRGRASRFEAGGRGCERSAKRARGDAPMFAGLCEGDKGPAARVVSRRAPCCARNASSATSSITRATSGRRRAAARLVINDDRQSMKSKGRAQLCRVRPCARRRSSRAPIAPIPSHVASQYHRYTAHPRSPSASRARLAAPRRRRPRRLSLGAHSRKNPLARRRPPRTPSSPSHPAPPAGIEPGSPSPQNRRLPLDPALTSRTFASTLSRAPRIAPDPSCKSARSPGREDRPGWGP